MMPNIEQLDAIGQEGGLSESNLPGTQACFELLDLKPTVSYYY
jgi:hypothetical protein